MRSITRAWQVVQVILALLVLAIVGLVRWVRRIVSGPSAFKATEISATRLNEVGPEAVAGGTALSIITLSPEKK